MENHSSGKRRIFIVATLFVAIICNYLDRQLLSILKPEILEYFGMKKDEAQQELEHGLMYKLMMAASKKYKPYGTSESAVENPHPVAEVEEAEEIGKDAAVEQPHRALVDLSAFSMEGLL